MSEISKETVHSTLAAENLGRFNWLEDRRPRADEVGIVAHNAGWRVYVTDERENPRYDEVHGDEGEALSDFLARVRGIDHSFARREERRRQEADSSDA